MNRFVAALALLLPLSAHAFALNWPLQCQLGKDCFIQNYVDHDPTDAPLDYTCHRATYHGHDGNDIRLRSLAAMRAGVPVLAAADGTVIGTRDSMEDISIRAANAPDITNHECGNGVHLQHAEGYQTQYCHMQKGSIRVHTGQQVKAGEVLGLVGLSGDTEFPHLHITVWKDGAKIDPFTSSPIASACDAKRTTDNANELWATPIPYQPTALLNDGFASSNPDREAMRDNPLSPATLPADSPALIYWTDLMNIREGDMLDVAITGPGDIVLIEKPTKLTQTRALLFSFLGKKNSEGKFAPGTYRATVTLTRDGETLIRNERTVEIQQ